MYTIARSREVSDVSTQLRLLIEIPKLSKKQYRFVSTVRHTVSVIWDQKINQQESNLLNVCVNVPVTGIHKCKYSFEISSLCGLCYSSQKSKLGLRYQKRRISFQKSRVHNGQLDYLFNASLLPPPRLWSSGLGEPQRIGFESQIDRSLFW